MKVRRLLTTLMVIVSALTASAQGWPENYGGVMLQGFWWDSFEETKWSGFTEQSDELAKFFDLLWVPQSGFGGSDRNMGYMPMYWYNQNSSFGKAAELKTMISTLKEKGVGVIADVVINHRAPNKGYVTFPKEKNPLDGQIYQMTGKNVCRNDDGGYVASLGYEVGDNDDSGDDFSGARDLDHKSADTQNQVKAYLKYLIDNLGYTGFRLDMVKGYAPEYTKMYNEYSNPQFCVGEFWDGKDGITWWINGTGKTSGAFDFPLKYQLNKAFGSGDYSALNDKGMAGDPSINRYMVTFVDNHDSDREDYNRCLNNQLGATAFILGMPGTPCVFLKHWLKWKKDIGNMILARKAAGLTNQSQIVDQHQEGSGYVLKTQGSVGTILVTAGNVGGYDTSGFKLIASGTSFAFYVSNNVNVEGLDESKPDPSDYKVFVCAHSAPNLYAWDDYGTLANGEWPGTQMTTTTTTDNGTEWYVADLNGVGMNLILNNGTKQTGNIEITSPTTYLYYNGRTAYQRVDESFVLPEQPKGITVHVTAPKAPFLYAWDEGGTLTAEWPGNQLTETEVADNGTVWYTETFDAEVFNIIFNNGTEGDMNKTADIENVNKDVYYAYNGANTALAVTADYEGYGVSDKVVVHVCADEAPNLYAWDDNGELNGTWPGTRMTETTMTPNGTEWYTHTFYVPIANIIFNNGTAQTANIENVTGEVYYAYNGTSRAQLVDENYVKGSIDEPTITIYVNADEAPYLYVWDEMGTPLNGVWPGTKLTETEEVVPAEATRAVDATLFYKKTFVAETLSIVINNGQEGGVGILQTDDITGITSDAYFTYDGEGSYEDVTDLYAEFQLPACARYQPGKLFIYFEANADYTSPYVWAWSEGGNVSTEEWPGNLAMTRVGDNHGKGVYTYVFETEPSGLLFSNVVGGSATAQTADFDFTNGGYYTVNGLKAVVPEVPTAISEISNDTFFNSKWYDLQGRPLNGIPQRGIYIGGGKKVVVKK